MAVLLMSLLAAVVLGVFSRKRTAGDNDRARGNESERAAKSPVALALISFCLLLAMIVLAGPVMTWLGPDSAMASFDAALQDRTSRLIEHVSSASALANRAALLEEAACAAVLCAFAAIQRNRFR